jgi:hypothetical protein
MSDFVSAILGDVSVLVLAVLEEKCDPSNATRCVGWSVMELFVSKTSAHAVKYIIGCCSA